MKHVWIQFLKSQSQSRQAGFSLIEIMVVIIIIGLIATFVGGNILGRLAKAKQETAKIQIKNFEQALDSYKLDCGSYPGSLEELISGGGCKNFMPGGYLKKKKLPKDPWGNDYVYEKDGSGYRIISYGEDKSPGGNELDKDIVSDEL